MKPPRETAEWNALRAARSSCAFAPAPLPPASALFSDSEWTALARRLALSERELQIVRLVFDECSEELIAAELGISAHTVHTYFGRMFRKLGVRSRCGLLVRIFSTHLRSLSTA